jgi:RND family efflux transporter MFP subunit
MSRIGLGRRPLLQFALVAVLGVAASALVIAGSRAATKNESPVPLPSERPQPLRVTQVSLQPMVRTTTFTGTVRPRYSSAAGFRIDGKMTERLVEVGQTVRAGEPLARLDETDIRLSIASLEADLVAARSNFSRLEAEVSRNRTLFLEGHVAKAALDTIVSQRDQARATADGTARALDQTRNQLAYTTLSADNDGVVTEVLAEAGQVIEAGAPVVTIARTDALDAVIALPEQRRFGFEVQSATATLWDSTHPPYRITLREVSPDVDPVSRTYTARFTIDAPDLALSLGRTLTVQLVPPSSNAVAVIPLAALLNDGRGSMVWKLSPDGTRVEPNPVEISSLTEETAVIASGLESGDRIVSLGVHKVDPGRPVRVIEQTAPPMTD